MSANNSHNGLTNSYLQGGGEMGSLIRLFNWAESPLGHPDHWPQNLLTTISIMLHSRFPMFLWWGPELIQFYNDAYRPSLGNNAKHPMALGQKGADCWPETWPVVKPLIDQVMAGGEATWSEDRLIPIFRNNQMEDAYWTFGYSPVNDENGKPAGVLAISSETTELVKSRKGLAKFSEEQQALNEELSSTNEELSASNDELKNANAILELKNAEVKLVEQQLRESEEKYKQLFQFCPLPIWIYDRETLKILDVNETSIASYGFERDEFLNMNILDIRPVDEIPEMLRIAGGGKNDNGLHLSGKFTHLKKDKTPIRVEVYSRHLNYMGRDCVMVISNDITEKEKAINELQTKEERFRAATEIAKLGYWQVNLDGTNRYWSAEVYNIWNVSKESFVVAPDSFLNTIHPEDKALFDQTDVGNKAGVTDRNFEYRILMPDGAVKWVHEMGKLVTDENGRPTILQGTIQDITAQKELELSLEESNRRFSYAARATSEAIWEWKIQDREVFKEHGYKELFGYEFPNNIGPVSFWASKVHPDDYDKIWKQMGDIRDNPELNNWTIEYRFLTADNRYIIIKEKAILLRDRQGNLLQMIGSMQDITKQKTEEQQLKLLESVVTHTNDAILITEAEPFDEPGPRILYVNDAFTRMTGYSAEEVIGKTPRILQGPKSDKEELKRLSDTMRKWQPCEINTINYKKNGQEFWVNFSVKPIADETGWFTHWIAIERDVTSRMKEELELKLFADDLYKHNKELQQFGYVVSHNLRAPVANIMGITALLEIDKDDPEIVEKCAINLKSSINRLDEVIRDLSEILSITDGSAELTRENIDFGELLNNIQTDLEDAIQRSGAKIEISAGAFVFPSHKAYLYSVFYNLVSNAVKYRSDETPLIKIDIKISNESAMIIVADNGTGIDIIKHSDDLFKPYRRFNSEVEGKGLGLFLVKSHIEALSGTIDIESELGKGTIFTITLPVKNAN